MSPTVKISMYLAIIMIMLSGCGEQPPESKARKKASPRLSAMGRDNTKSASKISKKAAKTTDSSSRSGSVASVIDYGTGTTHLKIRKRKREQLMNIQNKRNAQINKIK